jgi:hypothetical protein
MALTTDGQGVGSTSSSATDRPAANANIVGIPTGMSNPEAYFDLCQK